MAIFSEVRQWSDFLLVCQFSPTTVRSYRRAVVTFFADTLLAPDEVTEADVVNYLARDPLTGERRSPKGPAAGMMLRALRSFFGLRARRTGDPNPVESLAPKRPKYGPAPSLSEDDLIRLVIAAAWRSPRRGWTMLLLYATGIRLGSACGIRPEDVRDGLLRIRVAKGDRPYGIDLGPIGRAAAQELLKTATPTSLIGAGEGRVWEWIHQASLDSGVPAHPHLFRHTWATRHIELGTDVRTLQELGNWADLSQIPRYTWVRDDRKRAAQQAF